MEPAEASVLKGIADMGLAASSVRIARKYAFVGKATEEQLALIAGKVLANECIEEVVPAEDEVHSRLLREGQGLRGRRAIGAQHGLTVDGMGWMQLHTDLLRRGPRRFPGEHVFRWDLPRTSRKVPALVPRRGSGAR